MAAVGHFGCPNFTFNWISGHFRSIRNLIFLIFFDKMVCEIHFRSHFWPFRSIRNFYFFFKLLQNAHRRTFWMFENHFWLHFWLFQIDQPFWMSEIHFRSIAILAISDRYRIFFFSGHLSRWQRNWDAAAALLDENIMFLRNIINNLILTKIISNDFVARVARYYFHPVCLCVCVCVCVCVCPANILIFYFSRREWYRSEIDTG